MESAGKKLVSVVFYIHYQSYLNWTLCCQSIKPMNDLFDKPNGHIIREETK